MFTGIIESVGTVLSVRPQGSVIRLTLKSDLDLATTKLGDSIAIDGVCLTVTTVDASAGTTSFDVGPESLRVTALSRLKPQARVHLERAMQMGGRLDGHLVQGHVDGVGTVAARRLDGETLHLRIACPASILGLCIPKGSIGVSGVSLTLNALDDSGFEVWLIPHSLQRTHLGERKVGDPLNLENDLIGKYVQRLLGGSADQGVSWDLLQKSGFLDR